MEQVTVDEVHKYYIIKHLLIYCTEKRLSTSVSVRPGPCALSCIGNRPVRSQSDHVSECVCVELYLAVAMVVSRSSCSSNTAVQCSHSTLYTHAELTSRTLYVNGGTEQLHSV